MQRWGRDADALGGSAKRILELNPKAPAVESLLKLYEKDASDARLDAYARLLYEQAVIAEGSRVKDPARMARLLNELLVRDAAR